MNTNYIIFYVEDDVDDQELFLEVLESTGNNSKVFIQENGDELLHNLINDELEPDVILLDINMPGKNGFQILREIKSSNLLKQIPIVIITSANDIDNINLAQELGASLFVSKPRSFRGFVNTVNMLLNINWKQRPLDTESFVMKTEI